MAVLIYYGHPGDGLGDEVVVRADDPLLRVDARGCYPPLVWVLRTVDDDDPRIEADAERRKRLGDTYVYCR